VFRFGAYESCGKCTPCRVGAARIEDLFAAALTGRQPGPAPPAEEWRATVAALADASLCGHGTGLAAFARSVMAHYDDEVDRCLA
jgi:formate dehydrogenase iron-sulfur subunit